MNTGLTIVDFDKKYLEDIKSSNLLPTELMQKINIMLPELTHNFQTQTIWRTETEIRCSVLNDKDFPDKASKYHQAKLEQMVFFDQLLQLSFDYRIHQQKMEIIETEIEDLEYELSETNLKPVEIRRLKAKLAIKKIEKEQMAYGIQHMQIQGQERVRELEIWSKIKSELDDGTFDKDTKDNNQLISLTLRYIQEAFNVTRITTTSDISSVNNIMAQFECLCKECINRGIMDEILSYFGDSQITNFVLQYFEIHTGQ